MSHKHQVSCPMSLSPSSPRSSSESYGTDDSIEGQPQQLAERRAKPTNGRAEPGPKSPILVKYNYYDYNGERQENRELLMLAAAGNQQQQQLHLHQQQHRGQTVQRQLSPTFRHNLDQILVSQNQHLDPFGVPHHAHSPSSPLGLAGSGSGPAQGGAEAEAEGALGPGSTATMLLARRYNRSSYEHRCLRCKKTVYQMDKVGPLKDFSFYHQNCFKCFECGTKLTLKTYFNNQHSSNDLEVYCHRHCPKTPAGKLDNQSVGIRAALNAPKVFDQPALIGPVGLSPGGIVYTANLAPEHQQAALQLMHQNNGAANGNGNCKLGSSVDSQALHIQHAMRQTRLQAIYKHSQVDKEISKFLTRRLEYLEPKQKLLEMRHREEEEQLFRAFEIKWRKEEKVIREQIRAEWQAELEKLLKKYQHQLSLNCASLNSSANVQAADPKAMPNGPPKRVASTQEDNLIFPNCTGKPANSSHRRQSVESASLAGHPAGSCRNNGQRATRAAAPGDEQAAPADRHRQLAGSLAAAAAAAAARKASAQQPAAETQLQSQLQQQQQVVDQEKVGPHLGATHEQQMIELERMNLEKTMTIKLDRKKETLKRKLKEFERQATAELVEKQSREMLTLIGLKLQEFKEEQKRKIGSDLEQFEALESLANQLGDSLQFGRAAAALDQQAPSRDSHERHTGASGRPQQRRAQELLVGEPPEAPGARHHERLGQAAGDTSGPLVSAQPPPPEPPKVGKWQLYNCEQPDELFKEIDARAINIAREDQQTFTELVHHLTRHCFTDIEKVRAIFRWITVKNLNTMHFDSSIKPDTPFGLLRGIKQGSESYHVLFKRLCSYAGLHCVVIKGYSKSAGYQPGVKFEGNRFRNSWNAVYVAGAWRFVQCNWGARHLVSVAVMQDKNSSPSAASGSHKSAANKKQQEHHLDRRASNHTGLTASPPPPQVADAVSSSSGSSKEHRRRHNQRNSNHHQLSDRLGSPAFSTSSSSSSSNCSPSSPAKQQLHQLNHSSSTTTNNSANISAQKRAQTGNANNGTNNDSLRYEYDDHYFLTDPDEFIYEFFPLASEWQLLTKSNRPITLAEFEQLPFVRSLFFKYGLYFPQPDIRSVLYTNSSGATTIRIGMPTHMIPKLIFHYNLKYFNSDEEHYDGISLKRFVMQTVESGKDGDNTLSNIISFRVHVPENGAYILDIFANSTTPTQYITGEPMKFKSVCKFKIIAKNLRTVMIPLPDCASGEYGPMKATRLFGIIPLTHENGLITLLSSHNSSNNNINTKSIQGNNLVGPKHCDHPVSTSRATQPNTLDDRFLEIQFRMTRPLLDFMASLHKNGHDERQLSKWIKIFIEGDIVYIAIKFLEDGQYGLDIYTRDQQHMITASDSSNGGHRSSKTEQPQEAKKHLLTHCCKYLINVRTASAR